MWVKLIDMIFVLLPSVWEWWSKKSAAGLDKRIEKHERNKVIRGMRAKEIRKAVRGGDIDTVLRLLNRERVVVVQGSSSITPAGSAAVQSGSGEPVSPDGK